MPGKQGAGVNGRLYRGIEGEDRHAASLAQPGSLGWVTTCGVLARWQKDQRARVHYGGMGRDLEDRRGTGLVGRA